MLLLLSLASNTNAITKGVLYKMLSMLHATTMMVITVDQIYSKMLCVSNDVITEPDVSI